MSDPVQLTYDAIREMLPDHRIIGPADRIRFSNIRAVHDADPDSLVFISKERADAGSLASATKARVILVDDACSLSEEAFPDKVFIAVRDPKLTFSKIGNRHFLPRVQYGRHPTAVIHEEADIAENVHIGAHCVIGRGVIGEGSVIHPNVTLYDGFRIGRNVIVHAGTVIGAEGFGYNRDEDGTPVQFPHVGGVVIEDDVEIGANTCIDRGALSNTVIRKGAKIDNLVHVAHNVVVGRDAYLIAHAMIGGSTRIGDRAYIAPSVSLKDNITVGSDTLVGMAASVLKSIPDGETWTGAPAQPFDRVRQLNQKLKELVDAGRS